MKPTLPGFTLRAAVLFGSLLSPAFAQDDLWQVLMPVDQQGRQRRTHVRPAADTNPLGRLNSVNHPLAVHMNAGGAQHAAEQEEV